MPTSATDLAGANFRSSVFRARNDGANTIGLVIQYFQPNRYSSDIHTTATTPTAAALTKAILYVHSLHMKVALKVLFDVTPPRPPAAPLWRWHVDPSDPAAWFRRATTLEVGLARLKPDLIIIGTEMGTLTSVHPATALWIRLIEQIRRVYRGLLTYEAQTPSLGVYGAEAHDVAFWRYLDLVTLSGYSALSTSCDASPAQLSQAWQAVAEAYYLPLERELGRPIVFGEVGYSSMRCDDEAPWEYYALQPHAILDLNEQARLYSAFFDFWSHQKFVHGALIWNWLPDPRAGGSHNRDFTPQNKPAERVLRANFTSRP